MDFKAFLLIALRMITELEEDVRELKKDVEFYRKKYEEEKSK